jgi:hypothetical protein
MARTKKVTTVALPPEWIETLKSKARKMSASQDKNISYSDLIRKALKKQYKLKEPKK